MIKVITLMPPLLVQVSHMCRVCVNVHRRRKAEEVLAATAARAERAAAVAVAQAEAVAANAAEALRLVGMQDR